MSLQEIRVGIIGAGANTRQKHIPLLLKQEMVSISAVANRSIESAEKVCRAFDIAQASDDPYQLINDPEIDAIVIGTWPYKHKEFTCAALQQGKHVMVEARMAMDADEAQEMYDLSQAHPELITQVVPAPFTLPYDSIVEGLVRKKIGKLLHVELRINSGKFPDSQSKLDWRQDQRFSGNNIMFMGIFYETLMRWFGVATHVYARGRAVVNRRQDEHEQLVEVHIPDHLELVGKLEKDDADFHFQFTQVCGFRQENECWIHGDQASLRIDFDKHQVFMGRMQDKEMKPIPLQGILGPGWRVEEEFVQAIRGEEAIKYTTFETGLAYMKFTDAVWKSMQQSQEINI